MSDLKTENSLAIINGVIYPMAYPGRSQALFARNGIIEAIGSNNEILSHCNTKTIVLDLKGSYVLPGLTDTHNHFLSTGRSLETLDLSEKKSISDIIATAKGYLENGNATNEGWFFAYGWDQEKLKEKRFLNRHDLDLISTEIPISFERSCGHIAVLNSKALELLHINRDLRIAGGIISVDESGEPNGIIREAAVNWARTNCPLRDGRTLRRWFKNAADMAVRYGITQIQTDDMETVGSPENVFELYEAIEEDGKMPLRVTEQWLLSDEKALGEFIERGWHKRHGNYFRSGPLKIRIDGTLGARTAALREEYSDDPGNRGVYTHSQDTINSLVRKAQEAGMQVAFYAIGDGAISRSLDAVEYAKKFNGGDISHRIVHCQICAQDLFERMAALGVMADIQPAFLTSDWKIILSRIGIERARDSYAWKSLINSGIPVGAGSDAPNEKFNPYIGLRAAILRRDMNGEPEHGWMPVQALDKIEALAMYTIGSSVICGESAKHGTLEVGKYADFAAFNVDPMIIEEDKFPDLRASLTVVDGKIRYIE